MKPLLLALALVFFTLLSCGHKNSAPKIAATSVPHSDLLREIKSDLTKEGVDLQIIEVDDYNLPNMLLIQGEVDANFFQHEPYLVEQNRRFNTDLIPLTAVHIEPIGIYSEKITSLSQLKEGSVVSIPSDPTNEARALALLVQVNLIQLREGIDLNLATTYDILENPKALKFEEIDAPFLPRTLADVDLAVIPANFALQAKLNPVKDALALEAEDSPYVNIVVIREKDQNRKDLQKLKQLLNSEKMRRYILDKYRGSIIPAF